MRICIIHATAGVGHQKAAEAIANQLNKNGGHDVQVIDALDYTHTLFKKSYVGTYAFMATKLPWIWARAFELLDIPWLQPVVRFIRQIYNAANGQRLEKFLIKEKFDYVICTHFLSTEVCNRLKREGKIQSKIIAVVTDYDTHHIWYGECLDYYTVATEGAKQTLINMGINGDIITVTGMPTDAKFSKLKNKEELCTQLGIDPNRFTMLITTSSFGFGPIEETVDALKQHQQLVICGRNQSLYDNLKKRENDHIKVFQFVDNMHEMMAVSDVIITKPGGLTVSEALICQLPMIFFTAIPGQEEHNIKVMEACGVGFKAFTMERIVHLVNHFSASPQALEEVRAKARAVGKPDAVDRIISLIK